MMTRNVKIQPKQVAAAILMVLFLFIHVVKVLHHHDSKLSGTDTTASNKSLVKSPDCLVCDYHFVKDAHSAVAEYTTKPPHLLLASHTDFLSQRLTSIGLSSSDRGPPAVA